MRSNADYAWWRAALAGENPPIHDGDPQCGWFKRRLYRDGPWLHAVIWRASDGNIYCQVGGKNKDAREAWNWLASNPITVEEYREIQSGEQPEAFDIHKTKPVT